MQNDASAGDQAVLDQLRKVGSDPRAPHRIACYLYFPSREAADKVCETLQSEGYQVEVRPGADGANWLTLASQTLVPTLEAISRIRVRLESLADEFGGEYDGWEAEVVPRLQ